MEKKKILGYRKFTSKAGKPCCIVQTHSPFTNAELNKGAVGNKIEEIWLNEADHDKMQPSVIGKTLCINYIISGGRANIDSVSIE